VSRLLLHVPGLQIKGTARRNKAKQGPLVNPVLLRLCLMLLLALFLALLAFPGLSPREIEMQVGDVADRDIKADQDLMILDQASTVAKRAAVSRNSLPIFDLDDQAASRARELVSSVFTQGRYLYQSFSADAPPAPGDITAKPDAQTLSLFKKRFNAAFGLDPKSKAFNSFSQIKFSLQSEKAVIQLVTELLERGIVADQDLLAAPEDKGVIVRHIFSKREKTYSSLSSFLSLRQAQQMVMARALLYRDDFKPGQIKAMVALARSILQPNMRPNQAETAKRRLEAVREAAPVFFQVKRGEMIIREGERVDLLARQKLKALSRASAEFDGFFRLGGVFLLALIFLAVIYTASFKSFTGTRLKDKDLIFLTFLLAVSLVLAEAASMVGTALVRGGVGLGENTLLYLMPLAAGGMVAAIFLRPFLAVLYAIAISTLTGLLSGSFVLSFYYLVGAIVGLASVGRVHERGAIVQSGILVGLVNAGILLGLSLYNETSLSSQMLIDMGAGLLNGLLAGIIVTGLTPLIEMIFRYTTDIKLMELANLDRPILRDLMVQAPGTYHHSIIVGVMVEAAAETIGANPLLAKASAHYHDIGKLKKPLYFVENQVSGHNKHEKLAPSMSSLILISHIKDGVELARRNRLGQDIIDIIQQHHGTSLITYFYQKARDGQSEAHPQIEVEDYRYPGPKPQTKEAGLVLLADNVEAACRTLVEPAPARIQGMVQKIINNVFSDGQLDECELTLKDLHLIANIFNKILTGIFHRRIEYPELAAQEMPQQPRAANGYRYKQSPKDSPDKDQTINGAGQEDLRRLGIF